MLETLRTPPPDKILQVAQAFRADPREAKIDLGVGVYKDAEGRTPVMRAVKAAERRILEEQDTKSYTGLAGDPAFAAAMAAMILGPDLAARTEARRAAIATPGGTGAVHKGMELARMAAGAGTPPRVFLPAPTWPNHPAIARHLGLEVAEYRYFDDATGLVDAEGALADLAGATAGDLVVLHGCCHNPTGANPDAELWDRIAGTLAAAGAPVLIDLAYQGFGDGLEADAAPTRMLAGRLPEVMIAASCSKNFGIYRERTGALIVLSDAAETAQGSMAALNRLNYSFPPDHGARVVQTILGDDALRADWEAELEEVRGTLLGLRGQLARALRERTNSDRFDALADHRGMFSRLGLTEAQVERLRDEHGVYMTADSRMNVAGLNARTVPVLADAIAAVL